jgi:lipoprotein-anchoring transpeptidase ErfK/SrfK
MLALPAAARAAKAPAIRLSASHSVRAGARAEFRGRLVPPRPHATVRVYKGSSVVAKAPVRRDGSFYVSAPIATPGPFVARLRGSASNPVRVLIRPRLDARLVGSNVVGGRLRLAASVRPAAAGPLRVRVLRGGKLAYAGLFRGHATVLLGTTDAASLRVVVETVPRPGYAPLARTLDARLQLPELRPGSSGVAVTALANRLAELGYAVPSRAPTYDSDLLESVWAFQKVQGLARDGVVGAATWRVLDHPRVPQPRYALPATHVEVDVAHQVLYDIRDGRIAQILPVATAGIPGYYTPRGRFAVYRKVPGWDTSPLGHLYDPLYFTGGYAIHGYPDVPPYPASHGCVRIPMWASAAFYESHDYGETVYVY